MGIGGDTGLARGFGGLVPNCVGGADCAVA